jgi:cobalt-zinc-cadmium efflux system outer membrane protein
VQNGLNLIRDVRVAHTDFWFAEQRTRILQESADLRARIASLAERRRESGDGTGLDVSLARTDAQVVRELADQAGADIQITRSRLRYLMGMRRDTRDFTAAASERPALPPLAALLETAVSSRPDLRAAELRVETSGERAKWEQSQILALLAPSLSIKEVGADGLRAGPGLNMEIPILSRNQGRISRADAEVVRTGLLYAALRDVVEQEVTDAYQKVRQAEASLEQIRTRVRTAIDESIELVERAYKNGDVSLLNVLEATRQRHDVSLREAEAEAAIQRGLAELQRAMGRNL